MLLRTAFASAVLVASASAVFAESFTTRIETRPFYSSITTVEQGVRVIRPLPPERQVIINPNGKTPLTLSYNDTRIYENRNAATSGQTVGPIFESPFSGRSYYGANGFIGRGFGGYSANGRYGGQRPNSFRFAPRF